MTSYIFPCTEKDYATHNFLQWYVNEQMEEEHTARTLNDKLELVGDDKGGLYLFDRDIMMYRGAGEKEKRVNAQLLSTVSRFQLSRKV